MSVTVSDASAPQRRLPLPEFVAMLAFLFATVAFSIDAMLPALPDIAAQLTPGNVNRAQLILTAFMAGMGIGTLFAGPVSDAIGRRIEQILLEHPAVEATARRTGRAELDEHAEELDSADSEDLSDAAKDLDTLLKLAKKSSKTTPLVLVYAAKDRKINHANVLADWLTKQN
mgnify:CR=1 FL=1